MKIRLVFLLSILLLTDIIIAQTIETDLQNKYWAYRERYRKLFVSIGPDAGQSLPFSDIKFWEGFTAVEVGPGPNFADVTHPDPNNPTIQIPKTIDEKGFLNIGGDVTAYYAEYLGILATECWLLKTNKQENSDEMTAVLNELYFALNAIERLDKTASYYFNTNNQIDGTADGFFIRDDSPASIQTPYQYCYYPQINMVQGINAGWRELISGGPSDKFVSIFAVVGVPTNNKPTCTLTQS